MSFGLKFVNNSDVVTLDSEFSRLVVLQSGTYIGGANFTTVITSQEPPLVFIKPDATVRVQYATVLGSPGNWTGWNYVGGGSGIYFAAAFQSKSVDKFGLRLWNDAGTIIFDSGTPCAIFTSVITSYTYTGSTVVGQGLYRSSFVTSIPANTNYVLLNTMGMDVAGTSTRYGKLGCLIEYSSNRITMEVTGVNNETRGFFVPLIFAKPI